MAQLRFTGTKVLVSIAALIVVVAGLKAAQSIMIPVLFALFLAILGAAPLYILKRLGLPNFISVFLVAGIMLAVAVGVGTILARSVNEFTSDLPRYTLRFNQMVEDVDEYLADYGIELPTSNVFDDVSPRAVMGMIGATLRELVAALSSTFLVFVVMLFMLFEAAQFRVKLQSAMGDAFDEDRFKGVAVDVQRYLGIKTFTSIITGIAIASLNGFMGIEFAILWGLLAFLMNYIPFIGSILASVPAIIMALVQFGFGPAAVIGAGYLVVNVGVSNFLEPVLMGRRLGLSPLVVFLSLVVWGWIWGPAGMLLSVPLTMIVKILLEHSEEFQWVAILMDNRPREAKLLVEGPP